MSDRPDPPDAPAPTDSVEAVRARLEEATRDDPRKRFRILVAAHVLLIVDRQIGRGEGPLESEWERLGAMVQDQPGAPELVESLRAAVSSCEAMLTQRLAEAQQAGLDEPAMREAVLSFIRTALLEKLQVKES